jgi:hypothetical protein
MVDSHRAGLLSVLGLSVTGHRDDDRLLTSRFSPEPSGNLIAVQAGQADIQQDEIRPPVQGYHDGLETVADDLDLIGQKPHESPKGLSRIRVILDYEDARPPLRGVSCWNHGDPSRVP